MEKKGRVVMEKFELGRLLGQGTFAKVYYARNTKTGQSCAIKIIDKEKIMKGGLIDQIKREISVMRLVKHPNVVRLYEVMASKSKIYFVMEYVKGGELFGKVAKGKLREDDARLYFQQLIAAVDYCHSRGVYHRDLKPENLLVDENGKLKVSDFGLSALRESRRQDGLLHTTCGTPAYVAPEVIDMKGYDGAKVDIWSCGVILYVLLAGFLPFHDENLMELYKKISKGEFRCPQWFPPEVRKLLSKILDPNPSHRITVAKLMENSWYKKGYKHIDTPPSTPDRDRNNDSIIEDVHAAFDDWSSLPSGNEDDGDGKTQGCIVTPSFFNAFDLIALSQDFDLSGLFEEDLDQRDCSRFTTKKPATDIVSKFEEIAQSECFRIMNKDGKVKLQGVKEGRKGLLAIDAEIFEVTPSFYVVEMTKTSGDTLEYKKFCKQELKPSLKDIVWAWQGSEHQSIDT
ncbi:CBL-interacting serine/threonine-protein kinase 10 [Hibiscus syriacus]|uniref:non-specific serine/threonine protein kinase n=1 Tax=Hibiscus syriacus TaxID=106335 RepID=A0A6A3A2G4_HIBSY|nr:CBL-interacting serine/threonine-protein kinase 20-like [Hibiscus syriacus]KAE8697847.1 CBL-interacting serine/threonine-protein kinase 10 [Hibiscus syriacus]